MLDDLVASLPEGEVERKVDAKHIFKELKEKVLRDEVLEHGVRLDGRKFDEVRPISDRNRRAASHSRLGGLHARRDAGARHLHARHRRRCAEDRELRRRDVEELHAPLQLPAVLGRRSRPFMRGPGRREVGHGALAERSLAPMMPAEETFPYTVRIVSDILESNGSSSMASVCGGSLAMMDAGVPIKSPVAGIAMGLVMDETTRQIRGPLRHRRRRRSLRRHGLQGRRHRDGITALQMDIKVGGITTEMMQKALEQARQGRLHILEKMHEALAVAPQTISAYAPRIVTIRIPVDKIRDVIGPGGKMIRSIIERTGVKIDVEDDGRVNVASADEASAQKAISIIQELTATPELNKTYLGKVQRITDFGAFVEIMPGTDGLLHVSEIANHRVKDVRDELKEGEQILVKVINIDPTGKIRLSRKALLQPDEAGAKS